MGLKLLLLLEVVITSITAITLKREVIDNHVFTSSPSNLVKSLSETASMLASSISGQYDKDCLKVGVNVAWGDEPQIILNEINQAKSTLKRIKESTAGISSMNCIMFLFPSKPSDTIIESLNPKGKAKRFFIVFSETISDANSLLLAGNLREEEYVVAIVPSETTWSVYIRKLYTPRGYPQVIKVLDWNPSDKIDYYEDLYPEQMKNFYGTKFQATTLEFRPFSDFKRQDGDRRVIESPCLDIWIFREMARKLNFTYEIVMPEDGLWGTLIESNNSWTGVMGAVQHRKTNLSLVLSLTQERTQIADFTKMYFTDPLTYVTAKSRPLPQWQKVFEPFAGIVWVASLSSIVVAAILYHILRQGKLRGLPVSVAQSFLDVFGSFFSQSVMGIPIKMSAQIFIGFWFIYGLLITSYYKSALMAVLAVPAIPPTLNTLTELLNSDLEYGMIDAKGSEYQLFSTSKVELYQQLFQKMSFYSSTESMERVAEGKYGYIYFKANLESIVSTQYTDQSGRTSLHIASEEFFPGGYSWAFPKGVPYARTFDQVMWRCVQAGLISKWVEELNKIYWQEIQHNKTPQEKEEETRKLQMEGNENMIVLNLSHLQGVFLALLFGLGAGILCFLAEMILPKRRDSEFEKDFH